MNVLTFSEHVALLSPSLVDAAPNSLSVPPPTSSAPLFYIRQCESPVCATFRCCRHTLHPFPAAFESFVSPLTVVLPTPLIVTATKSLALERSSNGPAHDDSNGSGQPNSMGTTYTGTSSYKCKQYMCTHMPVWNNRASLKH